MNDSLQYQYNIKQTSDEKKKINFEIVNWPKNKFSKVMPYELYCIE